MVIVLFRARIELGLIAVEGHLALWRNGVYHSDVSASNLMYKDEGGKVVGVLNDFDDHRRCNRE